MAILLNGGSDPSNIKCEGTSTRYLTKVVYGNTTVWEMFPQTLTGFSYYVESANGSYHTLDMSVSTLTKSSETLVSGYSKAKYTGTASVSLDLTAFTYETLRYITIGTAAREHASVPSVHGIEIGWHDSRDGYAIYGYDVSFSIDVPVVKASSSDTTVYNKTCQYWYGTTYSSSNSIDLRMDTWSSGQYWKRSSTYVTSDVNVTIGVRKYTNYPSPWPSYT